MVRTTSARNKVSIHVQTDDLHSLARCAGMWGVSLGKAAKIVFTRGLTSIREGDPVLTELDEIRREILTRDFEQIALQYEAVIALRYLVDKAHPGQSSKNREFSKEAMARFKEKLRRSERPE